MWANNVSNINAAWLFFVFFIMQYALISEEAKEIAKKPTRSRR
jgi:hypothetical protein